MKPRAIHRLPQRQAGFTLVEVLVALLIMTILATLSWQALDGVLRARDASRVSIDRTVRLGTILTQWEQDLQAVYDSEAVPPLAFDGQTLRLTRRTESGVALVAWSVRSGVWQRWTGPAYVRSGELQEAWLRSQQMQGTEPGHVTLTDGASTWQVYFARGGQWTNAQSTGDLVLRQAAPPPPPAGTPPAGNPPAGGTQTPSGEGSSGGTGTQTPAASGQPPPPAPQQPQPQVQLREALPEGVRLVITLNGQTLTRDIALGGAGS